MVEVIDVFATHALVVAMVLGPVDSASASPRPQLLFPELKVQPNVDEGLARVVGELLLSELGKSEHYAVLGGSDIDAMLSAEEAKVLAGCDQAECLAEILGAVGAEFVLAATLGRLGDLYVLNLKILHAKRGSVTRRWSEEMEGNDAALLEGTRRAVAGVLPGNDVPALELRQRRETEQRRSRWIALGTMGVGVLGLGTSGLLLHLADKQSTQLNADIDAYAREPIRSEAQAEALESRRGDIAALNVLTVVSGAVGLGCVIAGVVLLVSGGEPEPGGPSLRGGDGALQASSWSLDLGPREVGLHVSF